MGLSFVARLLVVAYCVKQQQLRDNSYRDAFWALMLHFLNIACLFSNLSISVWSKMGEMKQIRTTLCRDVVHVKR